MDGLHYLLDTNILFAFIRQPQGPVAATLAQSGYGTVCKSIVVAAELRFGAWKLGSRCNAAIKRSASTRSSSAISARTPASFSSDSVFIVIPLPVPDELAPWRCANVGAALGQLYRNRLAARVARTTSPQYFHKNRCLTDFRQRLA